VAYVEGNYVTNTADIPGENRAEYLWNREREWV